MTRERSLLARFKKLTGITGFARNDHSDELEAARREIRELRKRLEEMEEELARSRPAAVGGGRRLPSLSGSEARVFFVVGHGKSGTTWVRNVLNAHPEILCKGEGRFFGRDFVRMAPLANLERGWLKSVQPTSLCGGISSSEHLRTWVERSVWTGGKDVEEHLGNLSRLAIQYFLTRRLSDTGKKIVGDKTTFSSGDAVGDIAEIYPEAKAIHVIRDGRDVAVSLIHHMWNYSKDAGAFYDLGPEDLAKRDAYRSNPSAVLAGGLFTEKRLDSIARSWASQVGKAVERGPSLLGDHYVEVRYENLLERPEEETRRLLKFLGADAGEEAVRRCIEGGNFEKWSEGRARGWEDSRSFYRKGMAGDWARVFTGRDREIFKSAAGEMLVRLGYEKYGDW